MFELRMFRARDGDCLLLSYQGTGKRHHVVVDGGRSETYGLLRPVLARIGELGEKVDLLVSTHLDADHIEGLLAFAQDADRPAEIGEVWFNGFDQISRLRPMGFDQADAYSAAMRERGPASNARFDGGAVCLPDCGKPPVFELEGGCVITLLSPDRPRLARLASRWADWRDGALEREAAKEARRRGRLQAMGRVRPMPERLDVEALAEEAEEPDTSVVNGTSIAFVAEAHGARALLAADAHPDLLVASLSHLRPADAPYHVDLLKLSHHGSAANTTTDLIRALDCRRFAFSTDGSRHGHPDPQAVAKLLRHEAAEEKEFWFNYDGPRTRRWAEPALRSRWKYACHFPRPGAPFALVRIDRDPS